MSYPYRSRVLDRLGVRSWINAKNWSTNIGGNWIDDRVLDAMHEVAKTFVDMHDLYAKADARTAQLCSAEEAHITTGAGAAVELAVAGCMAGSDYGKWMRLPDSGGMRDEVLLPRGHYIAYTPQWKAAGARTVEYGLAGTLKSCKKEIEASITDRTCCLSYTFSYNDTPRGDLPFEQIVGFVTALEIFLEEGDGLYDEQLKMAEGMREKLSGLAGIAVSIIPNDESYHEHPMMPHVPRVLIEWDAEEIGLTSEDLDVHMAEEDPPVFLRDVHYFDYYTNKQWRLIDTFFLRPPEVEIVVERLERVFTRHRRR
ncbi:MAG: hypothetical protein JRG91_19565 [Deltaproteobacteria bacterium]|nr:hypothetical protein [Deltaproteobacteria bacterium]